MKGEKSEPEFLKKSKINKNPSQYLEVNPYFVSETKKVSEKGWEEKERKIKDWIDSDK